MKLNANYTIAAIATPPGRGGIGILRLSGPKALEMAYQITRQTSLSPRKAIYTAFYANHGELIDEGLLLYFKAPHSFTGEDVIEFQCHGSPIVLDRLLKICLSYGAVMAKPGEFSERAFLNHKIDLTQAESIADLINAHSITAARMAVKSLQGEFSKQITYCHDKLVHLRMYVEAAIDFPEEEIDFLADGHIQQLLTELLDFLKKILAQAVQGALIREGLSVVIAGLPNAGKSTLINTLAERDVAIVTDIAGTTRDVMREWIHIDDIPIHIVDTAGLRDSQDIVELEGIKRTWLEVSKADCILLLVDGHTLSADQEAIAHLKKQFPQEVPVILLVNKIDRLNVLPHEEDDTIYLSARTGAGIELLKQKIKKIAGYQPTEGLFLARRRHLNALEKAHDLLLQGQQQLEAQRAGELLAEDLRLAHQTLGEITGEFTSDDLLGKIFSSFCIGK